LTSTKDAALTQEERATADRTIAPVKTTSNAAAGTSIAAGASVLQHLYAIYAAAGIRCKTDSNELARRLGMDREVVEDTAAALRKRDLVMFEICDYGLMNLRLTPHGIEQIEDPTSEAEWHLPRLDDTF
jgi:hypothetical protein